MGIQYLGGWITLVGIAITLVGLVAVHLVPTGLNPVRDPVSQYHLTRYRPLIAVSTFCAGLAAIGAILALSGMFGSAAILDCVLLALFAVARMLINFLRMDAPGTTRTQVGRIHNILAFIAFGSATAVAFTTGGTLHDGGYPLQATWSTVFGVIAAIGTVGLLAIASSRRTALFGLFERVIYFGFIGWFILIGLTAFAG